MTTGLLTAGPLISGPTLSRARLDKSLVDKARSLRASVAELLVTAPEPPGGIGKTNAAAAQTSRAAARYLVLELLDREAGALMTSGQDPPPALDERTLVELVLAMLFGLGLLQVSNIDGHLRLRRVEIGSSSVEVRLCD